MWAQLSFPWQAAIELAWEANCLGSLPIGAVIVDGQGKLVGSGRNRLKEPRGYGIAYLAGLPLAHAEVNALIALDYQKVNPRECTLYTTTEPCPMCAGALVMAGVRHVCFASRDPWAGSTGLYATDTYIGSKHVRVEGPPDEMLEAVLVGLQVEFFFRESVIRGKPELFARSGPFFTSLEAAVPQGVALGEKMYQLGRIGKMRVEGIAAGDMIEELARELLGFLSRI